LYETAPELLRHTYPPTRTRRGRRYLLKWQKPLRHISLPVRTGVSESSHDASKSTQKSIYNRGCKVADMAVQHPLQPGRRGHRWRRLAPMPIILQGVAIGGGWTPSRCWLGGHSESRAHPEAARSRGGAASKRGTLRRDEGANGVMPSENAQKYVGGAGAAVNKGAHPRIFKENQAAKEFTVLMRRVSPTSARGLIKRCPHGPGQKVEGSRKAITADEFTSVWAQVSGEVAKRCSIVQSSNTSPAGLFAERARSQGRHLQRDPALVRGEAPALSPVIPGHAGRVQGINVKEAGGMWSRDPQRVDLRRRQDHVRPRPPGQGTQKTDVQHKGTLRRQNLTERAIKRSKHREGKTG
jgi:hypothetical protein